MTETEIPLTAYLEELAHLNSDVALPKTEKGSSVDPIKFAVSYSLEELIENTKKASTDEKEKIRNLHQQLIDLVNQAKNKNEIQSRALELLAAIFDLDIEQLVDRIPQERLYNRFIRGLIFTFEQYKKNASNFIDQVQ